MAGRDWKKLAAHVVRDRVARGYGSRAEFATATGVTDRTLGNLERGQSVSAATLSVVESALHWVPGSAAETLDGGQPTYIDAPPQASVDAAYADIIAATPEDFVKAFRGAESAYRQAGDREGPDRWLRNAITAREEAIRQRLIANRDGT